jgi:hypothetical protein
MACNYSIRPARLSDVEGIFAVFQEIASQIPVNLTTPEHVKGIMEQITQCCSDDCSFVAVDENGVVVGFQLGEKISWLDEQYIYLRYAGVLQRAQGFKVFGQLVKAEKSLGLPLVAQVLHDNKREMVARLTHYSFRPCSGSHVSPAYRWNGPDCG